MKKQNPIILKIALIATILVNIILIVSIVISNLGVLRFNYEVLYNGAEHIYPHNDNSERNYDNTFEDEYNPFETHDEESAPKEITVTFNGKTYSGTYKYANIDDHTPYIIYNYECNDSSNCRKFAVNANTGKVTSIYFENDDKTDEEVDFEAYQKIANDIADDYINLSEYVFSLSPSYNPDNCYYLYSKKIDALETPEYIEIIINSQGKIVQFRSRYVGEFKNIKHVKYDEKKVLEAIRNKLDSMCVDSIDWIECDMRSTELVKLTNGKVALNCSVKIKFKGDKGSHYHNFLVT